MYTNFFGFHTKPFSMTPDPAFFYPSDAHREGLANLRYGIKESMGFIVLTGEVGTGKTLLIRSLLEELGTEVKRALILNPILDPDEMFTAILRDLEVPFDENAGFGTKLESFNEYLIEEFSAGRRVVVIIDESQNLSVEALERLRLLSNLETDTAKLLQIILVGQPELNTLLSKPAIRQLEQRVTVRHHLKPFTAEETPKYIEHRIEVASEFSPKVVFEKGALKQIHKASKGIPRLIGVLCDYALLIAFTEDKRTITTEMAKEAIEKHRKQQKLYQEERRSNLMAKMGWAFAAMFFCIGVFGTGFWLAARNQTGPSQQLAEGSGEGLEFQGWKDEEYSTGEAKDFSWEEEPEITFENPPKPSPIRGAKPIRKRTNPGALPVGGEVAPPPPASASVKVEELAQIPQHEPQARAIDPSPTPPPPTATRTNTPIPPTHTPTRTPTNSPTPTATWTATPIPTPTSSPTLEPSPTPEVLVASNDSPTDPAMTGAGSKVMPEQPREEEMMAIGLAEEPVDTKIPSAEAPPEPPVETKSGLEDLEDPVEDGWPDILGDEADNPIGPEPTQTDTPKGKYEIYRVSKEFAGPNSNLDIPPKYGVQLASLRTWERAIRMSRNFKHLGPVFLAPWASPEGEEWIRVVLGIYPDRATAFQMIQYLQSAYGIQDALIVENRWWRISPEGGEIEVVSTP
ncbi:MAG: AAA family ATPase [Candidatus Omnitrophica bacterium]|nr:AAA family ATPase [Candidatus Omnitrophota bacterium]